MSAPAFKDLFAWEWRRTGRSPLLWGILLVLVASFVWGAVGTAALHRGQTATMARAVTADAAWQAHTEELARAFRGPVTPTEGQVAYWQDPTNVAGYSEYFVRKTASKPHLPLSPLAAGTSDVAPSRLEIKLNALFGFADTYDFENPRGLALGRFDLAFAVVFLLPIALLLIFALLVTFERDREMLRLVAAQATGPRLWIGARIAAILAWAAPVVLIGIAAALVLAGVPLTALAGALPILMLLVLAYMLFWTGFALIVLARQPGAGAALGLFAAIWTGLTLGLPLAASALTGAVDPAPSSIAYVDAQRRTNDAIQLDKDSIIANAMAARSDLRGHESRLPSLDHATRLSFLVPETERRLASGKQAFADHRARQEGLAQALGYILPSLGVETALTTLAGTGGDRHAAFEGQARSYQLRLRETVYPLVQREIALPPAPETRATRGRLNLPAPLNLPAFTMQDSPNGDRLASVLPFAGWLLLLAVALIALGLIRAREWRVLR